jgi:hypothetical protein
VVGLRSAGVGAAVSSCGGGGGGGGGGGVGGLIYIVVPREECLTNVVWAVVLLIGELGELDLITEIYH